MQETPETRAKLANAITTLRSQGREGEVSSLVSQYKAKYRPETIERSATAPEAVLQGAAKTYKTLENVGQGAALSVGNLGTGIVGGALKLAGKAGIPGANTAAQGVENFRQKAFVQPTTESQKTFAGQAGKVAADVASYMIPGGGLAANVGKDALIGFGQSNGDVGAGLASGATTAITGGFTKIPGVNKIVSKLPLNKTARGVINTLAPGYTSDVVQGVAGQRGEDRTGVNALIPGAGTAFSAALGAGMKGAKQVAKLRDPQTHLNEVAKSWDVPENAKNAKFDKAKAIDRQTQAKGFDVKQELAQDKVFVDNHVTDGKYDTKDVANTYRQKAGGGSEYLDKAIKLNDSAVKHVSSKDLYQEAINSIDPTNTKNDSIIKYLQKEAGLQKDTFKFSDIYNKKKYYGNNANWKMGMPGDGIAEEANAILNKVFKDKLIEKGKQAGIPVEEFLAMQEQNYKVADYLDSLDGAIVPSTKMQKFRRGVLKVGGALLGSKGGPYGAVAGYHGAGLLDNIIGDLPKPLRDAVMKDYVKATPQVQKQMIEIIQNTIAQGKNIEQRMLSGKNTIFPTMDTSGNDIKGMEEMRKYYENIRQQNTLRLPEPTSNAQGIPIPLPGETASAVESRESSLYKNYPKIKPLGLPAPRMITPLNANQTYVGNYSVGDLAKIRQDTGGYLPLNKSSVARPTIIPNKAVSKKAIKVKLPRKTK